ncbi:MAG: SpoIIE family protein phosphatase [Bacteroidales bacterium]|nr:SpoIIE family protein phosphatase [Bacteroidales bacterium]MBN2817837.1 SpoIIE family protein phosphatase [Bacteroidales bacterium]
MQTAKTYYKIFLILILLGLQVQIFSQTDSDEALEQSIIAADTYLNEGNKAEAARLYNHAAYILRTNNRFSEAIKYYQKVLELNAELGNTVGQMLTHGNLSMLFIETEKYDDALKHLETELIFREKSKKTQEIIPVLVTIASVCNELNQFNKAIEYAQRAIDASLEINDYVFLKRAYGSAYDIYLKQGDQEKAQKYFDLYAIIDKKLKEEKMAEIETEANKKVSEAYTEKAKTETELKKTTENLEEAEKIAKQQKMELNYQQALINEQNALLRVETMKKRFFAIGFTVLAVFIIALVLLVFNIRKANIKINNQRLKLEKQNKEIRASIRYAKTIQTAMLPEISSIDKFLEHFVLYRPKDIVSGDFYWYSLVSETRMFYSVVDCTGHGVPGAFMSMIGIRMLDEIVNEMKIDSPAQILETLNEMLRTALRQEQTDNNDGMDMAMCRFDKEQDGTVNLVFSGAKRPCYIGRKNKPELELLKPDRKSIGGNQPTKREICFEDQTTKLEIGDNVFIFSDGIVDQNDPYRKKFGRARLESILGSILNDNAERQKSVIESKLDEFMKNESQRDDITLAGLKII